MKKEVESKLYFDIDYESFTTDEIILICDFFNKVSSYSYGDKKVTKEDLLKSYAIYRQVLNSIAFEKRYNKMFAEQTGIDIYHFMKDLNNK